MAFGYCKNLTRRTAYDKGLCDKAFDIAKNPKYYGYQRCLAAMAYKCFDNTISAMRANKFTSSGIKSENMSNKELAEELHKLIIRKF